MKLIRASVAQLSAKNRAWKLALPDDVQKHHQRLPGTFEPVPGGRRRTQEAAEEEEKQQLQQLAEGLHQHSVSSVIFIVLWRRAWFSFFTAVI